MNTAIVILIVIIVFFAILQKISDKTYKPTRTEIIQKLRAVKEGSIDRYDFDELISVRIAYDPSLEEIIKELNNIIDDTTNINQPHSKTKAIDLSEAGKKKIEELIEKLERQLNNKIEATGNNLV